MSNQPLPASFGSSPKRIEDRAILTGRGHYPSDARVDGMAFAFVVRSSHAHARFRLGGVDKARAVAGIVGILTHAETAGLRPLPVLQYVKNAADGSDHWSPDYEVLPRDTVRHVGEAVAFIVAESLDAARSAAELIDVDYQPLPLVTDAVDALAAGSPLVWPEQATNVVYDAAVGAAAATAAALQGADRVVELTLRNNRLIANYMEPRSILAEHDLNTGSYRATLGSQGVHGMQRGLAGILGIALDKLHVITPDDVGGGFGTKNFVYREYPLALAAARAFGRPVFWQSDRSEHFLADAHGRDNIATARLGLDRDNRFVGLHVDLVCNMGAYLSEFGPAVPAFGVPMTPGLYAIPAVHVRYRAVVTNTTPVDAYRGAGRPEAAYLIERLVDKAAREIGVAPDALRAQNYVQQHQFPYSNGVGRNYDCGEYEAHMRLAMQRAGWDGFAARAAESASRGCLRGQGLATYVEACAAGNERGRMELTAGGRVVLYIGTQANGQGHRTAYAQIAAGELGMAIEDIEVVQGDTSRVKTGGGTGGSKSVALGAVIVNQASRRLADEIRKRAADKLETATADIELTGGAARVVGTDRAIGFADIAAAAAVAGEVVEASGAFKVGEYTYPNGTHIAEVEIDPETGATSLRSYVAIDDFGVSINPMLLAGQVHGGIAQGLGQALLEHTVIDGSTGQLLSGSLMDYAVPRADDLVQIHFETRNVPGRSNPFGIKGAGEAGTIGACPAIINAVVDALYRHNGTLHIDMPATPEAIWRAIHPIS